MKHLLEVKNIHTAFRESGKLVEKLKDVSFHVNSGEIVCIVGESGCGKSLTALSIMDLLPPSGKVTRGEVLFEGKPLLTLKEKQMDQIRGNSLTMIFQDALTALNPVLSVGKQLTEAIEVHLHMPKKEARERARDLLEKVGLPDPEGMLKRYPHTLSGGMRQRVMIAMALSCDPKLLIADEPTTALDVTIQAQIIQLLKTIQKNSQLALMLITHDIGVVAELADRVVVMYAGQIVEKGSVWEIFDRPAHPYTQGLFLSVPETGTFGQERLKVIKGTVPENYDQVEGCRFFDRCPYSEEKCRQPQTLVNIGGQQQIRCWKMAEEKQVISGE